jgi:hypothetical protein
MKKFVFFFNLTAIIMFFILLFSTGTHADCTKDIDCKGNRICEKGICVDPGQIEPQTIAVKKQNEYDAWLKKLDGAKFVYSFPQTSGVSWSGPSGPFVARTKSVFIIKGKTVWFQAFDLSTDGQVLHTYPEEGPHQIEGRQFTSGGKTAVISEGGSSIKWGDIVWERIEF